MNSHIIAYYKEQQKLWTITYHSYSRAATHEAGLERYTYYFRLAKQAERKLIWEIQNNV